MARLSRFVSPVLAAIAASIAVLHGCGTDEAASSSPPGSSESDSGSSADGTTSPTPTGDASTTLPDAGGDAAAPEPLYPRYEGCEAPATTFARTLYVDPQAGSANGDGSSAKPYQTLTAVLGAKKLQPGDHVVLLPGDHGEVLASKFDNPQLENGAAWIWIEFQPGATAKGLDLRDMARWLITGAEITGTTKANLVAFSGGSNMILADSRVYTQKDVSVWTANDWINTAKSGAFVRNTTCSTLVRNRFSNVRFGVSVSSDVKEVAGNRMKTLVVRNDIRSYSADALRPNASDVTMRLNRILDEYVNDADGDGNHDDGVQSFALNGAVYDNILIETNWFQETTDPKRKLNAGMQGICVFDGLITHWKVIDNVVIASYYHGIAGYGIEEGTVDHNTVANPTENGFKTWITVPLDKDGGAPVNDVVQNNIAVSYPNKHPAVTYTNNEIVDKPADVFAVFDRTTAVFDLTPKPGSSIDGKGVGSSLRTNKDPRLLDY